jgi:hypothetical protein
MTSDARTERSGDGGAAVLSARADGAADGRCACTYGAAAVDPRAGARRGARVVLAPDRPARAGL